MKLAGNWVLEYRNALFGYLQGAGEGGLHQAYELGRKAIEQSLSILDVTRVQHELIAEVFEGTAAPSWQLEKITDFFAESLSPYEMTQRGYREANAKLLHWKHVFEHAGWGIAITSPDGMRLTMSNPAFARMHGRTMEELRGMPLVHLLAPQVQGDLAGHLRRTVEKGTYDFESVHLRKDGSVFPTWVDATAVRNERLETLYLAFNVQDITERKRADQALREAKLAAESANRDLEAFSYSVAHDLRAPLRAIDGFSKILLEDYASRLDQEGIKYLKTVSDGALRMQRLIDDLLEFSKAGRTAMNPAVVDMDKLVEEVIREQLTAWPARTIDVQVAPMGQVWADPALLRQVLVNLIGNAIKYTAHTTSARIEIGCSSRAGMDEFWVKDNGAGFDMAYVDKLFGVFQRLHTQSEFEGTGVGLALVQHIIQRHGGRVWASGKVGAGATFTFTLPKRRNVGIA